jgi:hypothetical protein
VPFARSGHNRGHNRDRRRWHAAIGQVNRERLIAALGRPHGTTPGRVRTGAEDPRVCGRSRAQGAQWELINMPPLLLAPSIAYRHYMVLDLTHPMTSREKKDASTVARGRDAGSSLASSSVRRRCYTVVVRGGLSSATHSRRPTFLNGEKPDICTLRLHTVIKFRTLKRSDKSSTSRPIKYIMSNSNRARMNPTAT